MNDTRIKHFIEAALLAAGRPLSVEQLQGLFDGRSVPERVRIRQAISSLIDDYDGRGITIKEVASGFRIQVTADMAEQLQKLWEERPPRYSRALFETLALIAYRQPMTRGEIEEIRGVSVSTNIIRTLLEREWIRVVGHRDVPGRPAMFGTTKLFLDYFNLKKLDDLPPLADLADWESLRVQLNLPAVEDDQAAPPETQASAEIPVLHADRHEGERPDIGGTPDAETVLPGQQRGDEGLLQAELDPGDDEDPGLEPIEATEWPDPVTGQPGAGEVQEPDEDDVPPGGNLDASMLNA